MGDWDEVGIRSISDWARPRPAGWNNDEIFWASEPQCERFIRTARELGCDEDLEAFKRALRQIAKAAPAPKKRGKPRDDDKPS